MKKNVTIQLIRISSFNLLNMDKVNRSRFTLSHELAHCRLYVDPTDPIHVEFRLYESSANLKEIEANSFEGELFVPEKSLEK